MTQEGFKRKLTAILSADVAGYSRLMGEDEEATVRTITAYREVLTTLIQQHNGKVLDSPGDNLLSEFVSVVDAVQCAVAVQKEIKARNDQLPENRRMQFRIGINLGDVIQEEERIYGDGVNIAARLEGLASPGGICISKTAFDQIESKLPYGYEFLGDQTVKNIAKPVSAYRVLMEPRVTVAGEPEKEKRSPMRRMPILVGAVAVLVLAVAVGIWQFYVRRPSVETASIDKMAFPLPEKPSIVVLPFDNLSDDPKQEYFTDGMTDELITNLSKISGLSVISRNSSFTYKGKSVNLQQVANELNVRYVLEGSVQRAGDRVRIRAQLIDGATDHHIWAESYDAVMKNIFDLQDEITKKIADALTVKLTQDEKKRVARKYTEIMEAYDFFLQGLEYQNRYTKEAHAQAQQMYERAIELDPEFAYAYAGLGSTYLREWNFFWSQDPNSLEQAFELAQKAIALDDSLPGGHQVLGEVYLWKKQHEQAIAELEEAIALSPNSADGLAGLGEILNWAGRPEETIGLVQKAMRLNPKYPSWYLWSLGHAYFLSGRYEEAIETLKRVLDRNPDDLPAHAYLAASYSELGRQEEARAEAAEVERLRIGSQTSAEAVKQKLPYKDQAVLERLFDSLRKAGLK
ncbi:MAG: adenylate/guanylate cyclase domain-containing protein [Nitrospirota bacterium]|nr:adenylate/guanylate cyclase domain-containing protein [Nitrospirota bacterium]